MSLVAICDLCGRPLSADEARVFKIKELKISWHERGWENIDAHNECIRKLLQAAHSLTPPTGGTSETLS